MTKIKCNCTKSKTKKSPWKAIKDHISVTKGSINSKNFEVFLTNLTHSKNPVTEKFEVCS